MRTPTVFVTDVPDADDVAIISDALDAFNVAETGTGDRRTLAVLARDPETRSSGRWTDRSYLAGSAVRRPILLATGTPRCRARRRVFLSKNLS
jgi:hypothetical protein